ncbi:LysR family transcriptional regulator [Kerstersia gyiorum]|jgi:DNA-binding transcriptional LysR family regulator|uniref:LysR family transcriptional regulator n=1 Tax=Kerstersia gyiorum TaxID=206506 RepID=UPI000FDA785D|nr:LysR substrate-binding domain-containing protein [Kerstersia gyiorum]AZV93491.1 LysR family transcriptional regulator [Bordetella sp. J329]MCH4273123.1 LysR substrate-binding domain-containing protein [Kerstersia gyiorum]MCI1228468.1 LysR substrate-binding domain-containing protein [Kerstersia gyiorum]MCP1632854.1 DNA-binding transcriptional LysR family regulator [Kerstersia gyiorum]MCP1635615.1 DNA-binding transcriptional LysR family regulator [Kerstersia gyiorum]
MKLAALHALVAAVEEGSLRGAARRIGTSQPALTKTIRELELELGSSLLTRTSRGVQPTAQGKVLYERALKATRELNLAVDEIHQMRGHMAGDLHISAVPVAVMLLVPELLRTFGQAYPDVRLRVSEELYVAQLQRLRTQEVDITVGGIPNDLPPGEFLVEPLIHTTMVPTARKGSHWLQARSLQDLQHARWVFTGARGESGYARTLYESNGLAAPPVGAIVNSTLALLSLVATGDYVGLMPSQIARHPLAAPFISVIPIREQGHALEIGAILRSDTSPSPLLRHIMTHLHRAAHHVDSLEPAGDL